MRLPFVSRGQYELLHSIYEQTIRERDAAFERIERLQDQMNARIGFAPVSAAVRTEVAKQEDEFAKLLASTSVEDMSSGQIDPSFEELIADAVAAGKVS
jgi:hypothetical protein